MLQYNKSDSESYGFDIYRSNVQTIDIDDLQKQIVDNNIDIAIVRIPTKYQIDLYKIASLGHNTVFADCIVEYTIKVNKNKATPIFDDKIEYVRGNENNKAEIHDLLKSTFVNYSNHYMSNPYLHIGDSLKNYKKWIDECIDGDGLVYLVKYEGKNAAFFSGRIQNNCLMGGPGGVSEEFAGCGIYIDAHKRIPYLAAGEGIKMCRTGTQIQNHTVQKQWALSGWTLSYSWITVHINAFIAKCYQGRKFEIDTNKSPHVQNVEGVLNILNTHLSQYNILSCNIRKHKNTFTDNLFLYISNPIINYSAGNDEALVAAIVINDSGQLMYTSQIFITQ